MMCIKVVLFPIECNLDTPAEFSNELVIKAAECLVKYLVDEVGVTLKQVKQALAADRLVDTIAVNLDAEILVDFS